MLSYPHLPTVIVNRPAKVSAAPHFRAIALTGLLGLFLFGAQLARSQVVAAEKTSTTENQTSGAVATSAKEEPKHLDKLLVTSDADEALPSRPSESIYGFDLLPQDTPRGIAQISSSQLANEPLRSLQDFARFSPGISPTYFLGDSLAPLIRGGVGQVYYNGLLSYEGDKHPLNFNAIETAEAVRGPATVIFGPTANTSGYLNYTLKQPRFDRDQTEISGTLGTWVAGGASYPSFTGTIDRTGPWIPGKLAYRVSYQQREGDLYYQPSHNDYQSIYAAVSWTPTKDLTIDASIDWSNYDYTEHRGWNRVTQRLVDDQLYSAGPATPIFRAAGTAANQYYKVVDGVKLPYLFLNGSLVAGGSVPDASGTSPATAATLAGWILEPQNVQLTKIYGDEGMADPSDRYKVRNLHFLSRQSLVLSPSLRLINNVIYTHYRQETFQFFGAYTAFARADVAEDRLEIVTHKDFNLAGHTLVHESNSGLSLRYQRALGYATVTTYQENPYDLTTGVFGYKNLLGLNGGTGQGGLGGIAGVNYSSLYGQYLRFAPQFPVDGGTFSTYGGSIAGRAYQAATAETTSSQAALFTQHNFKLGQHWGWNVGARATALHAKISNPLIDPSNPADAVGDSTTAVLPAAETSLTYKPVSAVTTYGTFDYAQSPVANGFTGNLNWAPGNQIGSAPLRRHSRLYEIGSKFELIPGKWFADVAAYHQTRVVGVVNGTSTSIKARGLELGTSYKPDGHWLFTGNFSWLVANYENLNLSAGAYSPAGFSDDGQVVFADGNGVNKLPPGNFRLCLPQLTANASVAYLWSSGLGVQLTGSWMNHYVVSYDSNVWVPWQYELNAAIFYRQPRWEVRLDVGNVTDQRNFVPAINDNNGADAITISQPVNLQASFRFRF